ncbi:hypothetical protein [Streptomyces griseorubiginosus]|uniref:hypothetical protein n=1 Tax=Streptomyces griseorubiginosus TaxID=67304 RepID=UPI0036EEC430
MSDSILVRVTLDSYDLVHPSEKQTQVYVQIPEVARASWLLDADFYAVLKNEPWPHVIDSAHAEYERRGVVSDSTSEAARKAIVDWLLLSEGADYDARFDAVQAAWEADQARQHPVARKLLARVAELEAAAYGDATVRLLNPIEQIRHLHSCVAAQMARANTLDRLCREKRARVAELESERHSTNESLSAAAEALRVQRDRIAELERLLADYTEPDVDGAGRTYESYQPPVSLSTDCANCGHTLNWHGQSGCSAGSAPARCGCRDFAPKQGGGR